MAKRYILDTSFHDPEMAETISLCNKSAVVKFLEKIYPNKPPPHIDILKGEVLIDSRGRGSFQKVI